MKPINKLIVLMLFICPFVYGQMNEYDYKVSIDSPTDQWHKILLPNSVLAKTSEDLSDIRLYGIRTKDTIEAPYLLKVNRTKKAQQEVAFELLNQTKTAEGHYFTFKLPVEASINQVHLMFDRYNFDWLADLEGSQNQQQWFTIVEGARILSIQNNQTDYRHTKLVFPKANYRYLRLFVKTKQDPQFKSASLVHQKTKLGQFVQHRVKSFKVNQLKKNKQTEIEVSLAAPARISDIELVINSNFDYYRPIKIAHLSDSVQIQNKWHYRYSTIKNAVLSSMDQSFSFNDIKVKTFKMTIENHDNQPLTIQNVLIKGHQHELWARFSEPASYYLVYGNDRSYRPHYDIQRFSQQIPVNLTELKLGKEVRLKKPTQAKESVEKSESKFWLWVVMIVVILLLGGFTLNMLKAK